MVRYSKVRLPSLFSCGSPELTISQLAFRQTVFEYGTDLCWTPMILAKEFNRNRFARDSGQPHSLIQAKTPL